MISTMNKNRNIIETDIASLTFYMKGGLNYNDAYLLTTTQRKQMISVIEKHYEAMNPNKKNEF